MNDAERHLRMTAVVLPNVNYHNPAADERYGRVKIDREMLDGFYILVVDELDLVE
jgi:hypothetical protein